MDDRELVLSKKRSERRQRWVQTKISIQVNRGCRVARISAPWLRNRNGRPQAVIIRFRKRNHNVQSVRSATLEQHYQLLFSRRRRGRNGALQKRGDRAHTHQRDSALLHEIAPRETRWPYAFAAFVVRHSGLDFKRSVTSDQET